MLDSVKYYFWASYRRKLLDKLQNKYSFLYKGIILDIGGRDRGRFKKPKDKVEKWTFVDIESKHNPDVILDVADMNSFSNNSIDFINAIELFEHVKNIEKGLEECYRVLKKDGIMFISAPFLYPIHADPYDFQRWTIYKWRDILKEKGFNIEKEEIMGNFLFIFSEYIKYFIKTLPKILKWLFYLGFPILDFLVYLDNFNFIKKNDKLNKFNGGYFLIVKK